MLASNLDCRGTGSTEVQLKPILSHKNLQAHPESRTQDPLGDHPDGDKKGKILATTGTWIRLLRGADDDEDAIHEQYLDETEELRQFLMPRKSTPTNLTTAERDIASNQQP
jgi:hypothetical protein